MALLIIVIIIILAVQLRKKNKEAVLIAFGTRNELEDKKPKAIEKLKNIKNNIDER